MEIEKHNVCERYKPMIYGVISYNIALKKTAYNINYTLFLLESIKSNPVDHYCVLNRVIFSFYLTLNPICEMLENSTNLQDSIIIIM